MVGKEGLELGLRGDRTEDFGASVPSGFTFRGKLLMLNFLATLQHDYVSIRIKLSDDRWLLEPRYYSIIHEKM